MINLFNNKSNDIFKESSTFIVYSKNDYIEYLKKYKEIVNTHRNLIFDISNNNDIINFTTTDYTKLNWNSLTNRSIDEGIVVHNSNEKNIDLEYNEIAIGLSSLDYINYKYILADIIDSNITFLFNGEEITFVISNIYDSNHQGEVVINQNKFNELLNKVDYYFYISQISNEKKSHNIESEFSILKEKEDVITLVQDYSAVEMESIEKSKNYITILTNLCYVVIIVFIIFIVIINRNILYDLKYNIRLENYFGFSKLKIKLYVMKRILSLYLLSFLLSLVPTLIIAYVIYIFSL